MAKTDTIDLIRKRLSSMPAVSKKIGTYILSNPQRVTDMTLRSLSAEVGVAEGSIINFTTRLGFDGYTSLKLAIARSLAMGEELVYERVAPDDSAKDVMRKMRDNATDALRATCESVTDEELRAAVELLTGAKRRIEVYGIGSSAMIAEDAAFRFIKLGLPAVVMKDSYIGSVSALMLDSDCLALAISYTGRTHDIIKTMSIAKQKGAKTMCITCYADSPLAQMCDLALVAVSGEAVLGQLATVSRIAQLMLIDTMCEYISSIRHVDKQDEIMDAWGEYWLPKNEEPKNN